MNAADLDAYVAQLVAEAPPFTAAQRDRLRVLLGPALPPPKRWSCPCGCAGPSDPDCKRHRPRSRNAGRAAWHHLRDLGLLDADGHQTGVLAASERP